MVWRCFSVKSYFNWLTSTFRGDLGFPSLQTGYKVIGITLDLIYHCFPGLFDPDHYCHSDGHQGLGTAVRTYDYTVSIFAIVGTALPSFFRRRC